MMKKIVVAFDSFEEWQQGRKEKLFFVVVGSSNEMMQKRMTCSSKIEEWYLGQKQQLLDNSSFCCWQRQRRSKLTWRRKMKNY